MMVMIMMMMTIIGSAGDNINIINVIMWSNIKDEDEDDVDNGSDHGDDDCSVAANEDYSIRKMIKTDSPSLIIIITTSCFSYNFTFSARQQHLQVCLSNDIHCSELEKHGNVLTERKKTTTMMRVMMGLMVLITIMG